ncbi:Eukaryotic/viral aspartic protease [Phytophthora megakarya]|uniref:Eukaryotic/viral aspartic protease n=1 Tax=Phytophthora megakarya TaxID=4795 RepID=A0A225WGD5_9STRA|nr:Eukaryotic/viral aspartic protease [Phytophthora megakarya]
MASLYYHASKHLDETPLKYLYRLNVAGIRAKICYPDRTQEEKSEQVLPSRLTLMEVPETATFERKHCARQHGLVRQKKTLSGSKRFRQKAATSTAVQGQCPV